VQATLEVLLLEVEELLVAREVVRAELAPLHVVFLAAAVVVG